MQKKLDKTNKNGFVETTNRKIKINEQRRARQTLIPSRDTVRTTLTTALTWTPALTISHQHAPSGRRRGRRGAQGRPFKLVKSTQTGKTAAETAWHELQCPKSAPGLAWPGLARFLSSFDCTCANFIGLWPLHLTIFLICVCPYARSRVRAYRLVPQISKIRFRRAAAGWDLLDFANPKASLIRIFSCIWVMRARMTRT